MNVIIFAESLSSFWQMGSPAAPVTAAAIVVEGTTSQKEHQLEQELKHARAQVLDASCLCVSCPLHVSYCCLIVLGDAHFRILSIVVAISMLTLLSSNLSVINNCIAL